MKNKILFAEFVFFANFVSQKDKLVDSAYLKNVQGFPLEIASRDGRLIKLRYGKMAREGGVCVVSIHRPLIPLHFPRLKKKDPALKKQKLFVALQYL